MSSPKAMVVKIRNSSTPVVKKKASVTKVSAAAPVESAAATPVQKGMPAAGPAAAVAARSKQSISSSPEPSASISIDERTPRSGKSNGGSVNSSSLLKPSSAASKGSQLKHRDPTKPPTNPPSSKETPKQSAPAAFMESGNLSSNGGLPAGNDEEGIVASSLMALARMSLEDAVFAAAKLQDLMMTHTALVTRGQAEAETSSAPQTHVNPRTLSTRPLDEIADDLAAQLQQLCNVYHSSSRAERVIMGLSKIVPECARPTPEALQRLSTERLRGVTPSTNRSGNAMQSTSVGDTFGAMTSTQLLSTGDEMRFGSQSQPIGSEGGAAGGYMFYGNSGNGVDTRGGGRADWMIDVGKANPGPRIAHVQSTQFTYPDGTTVSFPISTFGELVSTQYEQSPRTDDWLGASPPPSHSVGTPPALNQADIMNAVRAGMAQANDSLDAVGPSPAIPRAAAVLPRPNVVSSQPQAAVVKSASKEEYTQTEGSGLKDIEADLLQGYVRELESKLTDKQRLEALRAARGAKGEGRKSSEARSRYALTKSLPESEHH